MAIRRVLRAVKSLFGVPKKELPREPRRDLNAA
jgi:hypothetical protein